MEHHCITDDFFVSRHRFCSKWAFFSTMPFQKDFHIIEQNLAQRRRRPNETLEKSRARDLTHFIFSVWKTL